MSVIQSRKTQNIHIEKDFAGCLGRMVNLFDLSSGVAGNRLLTDKPHSDGSSLSRSQSDVTRMSNAPFADEMEDKMVVSELKRTSSNKKINGTPMKTLLAQEMSKDIESKNNPPNVVAKLMGLDAFPRQQSTPAAQRSHSKGYSRHSLSESGIEVECWEEDNGFLNRRFELRQCKEQDECKDVYEIWQRSQKPAYSRDSSMKKGRINENMNEKKMALIRQKFMEAKSLSTDEKLHQSKEYQDALEVLSSNQDLLVRFLQEPNSLFSQHLYDLQSIPPPRETKRITVLKPSKVVDNEKFAGSEKNTDKQVKKPVQVVSGWERNNPGHSPPYGNQKLHEHPAQSTRIVVLKPSSGKTHDVRAVVSKPSSPLRISDSEDLLEEPEDDDVRESSEVAKEMAMQMCENEVGHRRDETLLSSVFSNGYIGDESSFNKSENEYTPENLSDSETVSPTSRHSWDYVHKFGSPYSSSSFSRVSCSPESSVCREAKKRLSERWAMMALNGNSQEQRHVRRSSSTLGEMLALSDLKKSMISEDQNLTKEQEPRVSTSCLSSNLNKQEGDGHNPRNLMRSKSVPVSSSAYDDRLNVEISDHNASKPQVPKDPTSTKSTKSSLKGKVSSLFFLRSKKSGKENCSNSHSGAAKLPVSAPGKVSDDASQCVNSGGFGECFSPVLRGASSKTSSSDLNAMSHNKVSISEEAKLSVAKPLMLEHVSENLDQPSPISVLEPPFEDYDNTFPVSSCKIKPIHLVEAPLKSNLIDKSPPIESISRTLSWDDSFAETAMSYQLKPTLVFPVTEEEQRDWRSFVKILLSEVGLDGEVQSDTFFTRWHSPESPLDPTLRDKYASLPEEQQSLPLPEAKRRQRRSNRKLVFDCVNATLVETTGYHGLVSDRSGGHNMEAVVDRMWTRLEEWFSRSDVLGGGCFWGEDGGDSNSLVVDRVVRKEVVGKSWGDQMGVEFDNLGNEIELKLLDELVDEAVLDLTGMLL